jgi:type I restriction enzyme M protein
MVEAAKTGEGRVAVVVPHGVLFRGGREGVIRRAMIEENLLDAVIGLPPNLFQTTPIPVAVLLFDRRREKGGLYEKRKDILFIDGSKEFQPGKNQNQLIDANVDRIVATHRARSTIDGYARAVAIDEVVAADVNLTIARYIDASEAPEPVDIASVQQEIDKLENELAQLRKKMRSHLRELGISV